MQYMLRYLTKEFEATSPGIPSNPDQAESSVASHLSQIDAFRSTIRMAPLTREQGKRHTRDQITDQGIYHILIMRGKESCVAGFTPHDLRRSFAGDLLDAGADLSTVQKLMGHSDANATAGYDRRGEHAKRSAVRKIHVPYWSRMNANTSGE